MDNAKEKTMTKTASMMAAEEYIQKRFLLVERHRNKSYLDITDNEEISWSTLLGVILDRHQDISYRQAEWLLKHTYFNPYSGKAVFRPDHPDKRVLNINNKWVLNTYRKPKISEDASISPEPFLEHLKLAIKDEVAIEFVLNFLAYRYQNQYVSESTGKPAHALYIYSVAQGQGKSLFTDTITKIFGDSAIRSTTTADALMKQNGYQYWERTWLLADEVKIGDGTRLYDNLKARISKITDYVDPKNKASIEATLPAQLIMTSNHPPTFIEPDDRRFCIIEWDTGLRDSAKTEYFDKYYQWLSTKGYQAIAALLANKNLSDYQPMAPPPQTDAKRLATLTSEPSELDSVLAFLDENRTVFAFDSISIKQLNLPPKIQSQILLKAGLYKKRLNTEDGKRPTYWIRAEYDVSSGNIVNKATQEIVKTLSEDQANLSIYKFL